MIESVLRAARRVEDRVLDEVARCGYCEADTFAIRLALEEGINNAIKHGNRGDVGKTVEIHYDISEERAAITIIDQGDGFRPEDVPDPTADENLEKPCGRGIMLMYAYMDEVSFNKDGSEVRLIKRNTPKA